MDDVVVVDVVYNPQGSSTSDGEVKCRAGEGAGGARTV